MALKILFVGTGTFAASAFQALIESPHEVVGLVTQPDRGGPGRHQHEHPLKEAAIAAGVSVFQPDNVNAEDSLARLREFDADLFVVAAYGQILKSSFLEIPRLGAINIHASLLPRHRGAAPINYAILAGDRESGVTIFQIKPQLDAGAILGMTATPIASKETAGQLEERLAAMSPALLLDVIDSLERGTSTPRLQDSQLVTRAPKMPKSFGAINWSKPSDVIGRHVRAMQPWPTAYSFLHSPGQRPLRIVVLDVDVIDAPSLLPMAAGSALQVGHQLIVRTGDGALTVHRFQPAGKRAMNAEEFLRGRSLPAESQFGDETDA